MPDWARTLLNSPGIAVVLLLSVISTVIIGFTGESERGGVRFWLFARPHYRTYQPIVDDWNREHPGSEADVSMTILSSTALERRLLSGFVAGTPVPDVAESVTTMAGRFFAGPLDAVGFVDLTDRLAEEGLLEAINTPSFSPWSTRGRIFGLPHDVHPVLLGYRADIVEAAGIDMSEIETWDDFERIMRPLQTDEDGDGYPDRYVLNVGIGGSSNLVLLRQASGSLFNEDGQPDFAHETNARVLARIVTWIAGPDRLATEAPAFSAEGNQMYLDGDVLTNFMPDWMAGVWTADLPSLSGKIKLTPLPAFEPGGRRTSVAGGTMLGIPKRAENPEVAWKFAKQLYLSESVAEKLFRESLIISPVKAFWDHPMYSEPSAYYSGQAVGELYIEQAPHVPMRISSPYSTLAEREVTNALVRTRRWAEENEQFDREVLAEVALENLLEAEAKVRRKLAQNVFIEDGSR